MPSRITMVATSKAGGGRNPAKTHDVNDTVTEVVNRVNAAETGGHRLISVQGTDDLWFSLRASNIAKVEQIKSDAA